MMQFGIDLHKIGSVCRLSNRLCNFFHKCNFIISQLYKKKNSRKKNLY